MKRGDIPYYQNDNDPEDWNDYGPGSNNDNYGNERYNNAFGNYGGGYGPMNSGGFGPMNSGGFGPMNCGGFGPRNGGGFGPRNGGGFGPRNGRGFGPRNGGGFGPRNGGGFGPRNGGGFGPMGGYGPMNSGNFGSPRFMDGPPSEDFNQGPRPLLSFNEPLTFEEEFEEIVPSPSKKAHEKAFRNLLRCDVPRHLLKRVPVSILHLMEPEQCGVCGLKFNSDVVARAHYISKNHQKKQKKLLMQQKGVGSLQPKEIPFKSRDLYCELCDVHITSTSHAESHYAGKSHRAVVEGRKPPRNPLLLQRSMSSRLDQLIRREKRNLKPIEESEEKEEVKESRPFQAELYCKICKTSMTCSDQMTMHLNGKKHLNKEKQHILKTMKGENIEDEENEDGDEVVNERSEIDVDMAGDGEEKDDGNEKGTDDFDWGNGSGNWDEPECM